jgi:murein tripeptide amidase MpaA
MDKSAYRAGWEHYGMVVSYDRQEWFRVPVAYDGKTMRVQFDADGNDIWCAYFEPYSHERHLDFVADCGNDDDVDTEALGVSVEGRDITLLKITAQHSPIALAQRRKIWLIARQHPGESMAEWAAEGLIERLLDKADPVAQTLLERCIFHVVPRMNPDGAVHGNLRTNAKGADLNREWETPTLERSPEVFLVRQKMQETGVDLFIDAHGDEGLPYNFVAGCEGVPNYDARHAGLEEAFKSAWLSVCPDFQVEHGYPKNAPGQANLKMATSWIGNHFRCLAFTVEMPFKDNADRPNPLTGWNGERSKALGASLLLPMLAVLERLR